MRTRLLHREHDVANGAAPPNAAELVQDLDLATLFSAMAGGDRFLAGVARDVVLSSLEETASIAYRQTVLADVRADPATARQLYRIAGEAAAAERAVRPPAFPRPASILRRSVEVTSAFVELLRELGTVVEAAPEPRSEGLAGLFDTLRRDLAEDRLAELDDHLARLRLSNGMAMGARLGRGNRGDGYTLRPPPEARRTRLRERVGLGDRRARSFQVPEQDDAGQRALAELADRGLDLVADALARSCEHLLAFFAALRYEAGFYVCCVNLEEALAARGYRLCTPLPLPTGERRLSARSLYDVCLALRGAEQVVANDLEADQRPLVLVTGANSGGKTTFLRSVGVALMMLQCGMPVAAASFEASICDGLFTHFAREEDRGMTMGKLEEELIRMSAIADRLSSRSVVLLNESFAATSEREGSELAFEVVAALLDAGVRVLVVTHLFGLADRLQRTRPDTGRFLRAERLADGRRTFRLLEGEPLPTSFGEDVYGAAAET